MNVLDVNVLMALYRPKHVHHSAARSWFDQALAQGEPFTVPDVVWTGFLRLVTNRRVMRVPAGFGEAWDFMSAVREHDNYLEFAPSPRTLTEFAHVSLQSNASANLVTDAYIAACAAVLGATVVTFDRDFRKFDGVRVLEPNAS
jgi:toxin-antitoxin system PIN domain toxin